ncbi:NAD(P)H-quinone dehydrogenase [Humibacillus sp. DSM 29435]|uniref:NAD(P)H-quinone dehydrogenase n=1 Tax=Humibacillus sp. DSM 29435 TaxID=1869167 RepID=UPI0008721A97|nr:NAD(P)H-quinone dehydrogenase [Humibacillus sp. DSM 29435]OFE14543.1 NAD(P)H-quinone dehydrogenase [Humibacillus sp. DSM 29435]
MITRETSVVIVGGGPAGYEAALVAAQLGAHVTVVEKDGLGGAAVLTDCVPSKALIATADHMSDIGVAERLGVRLHDRAGGPVSGAIASPHTVNGRILALAAAQSADIQVGLERAGVTFLKGVAHVVDGHCVRATTADGQAHDLRADVMLIATGASPRVMPSAVPDGERILTWQQIYDLDELPERMIVIGSGVTGAELAQAFLGLGSEVVLVSSRDRVLPGEDADAATVIEDVFRKRGMEVLGRSRAAGVERTDTGVLVTLVDGRTVEGTHALLAVGSVPNTSGLGLEEVGVELSESGHVQVDRVSRTSVTGIYAAGDCTGVLPLASVAAMQGRIAMWHALGDAVAPLNVTGVAANIFTEPEIATVGLGQIAADESPEVESIMLPLARNPRAKMQGITDGFVKLFCRRDFGTVLGGVVVAPKASELIFPVALAVQHRLSVDQVASTITVYPSLSGSIAEAARQLHQSE